MAFEIQELPRVLEADIQSILLNQRRANLNFKALRAALGSGGTLGTAGRVPYFDASGNLTTDAAFVLSSLNMGIGTASPNLLSVARALTIQSPQVGAEFAGLELVGRIVSGAANYGGVTWYNTTSLRTAYLYAGRDGADTDSKIKLATRSGGSLTEWLTVDHLGALAHGGAAAVTGVTTLTGGVVFAGGGTNLNHYEEGTFTATMTDVTTSADVTARYVRIGKIVNIFIPAINRTSNNVGFTFTGMPSALWPARVRNCPIPDVVDNGTQYNSSPFISIGTGGVMTLWFNTAATGSGTSTFTNSGTKGINTSLELNYSLT